MENKRSFVVIIILILLILLGFTVWWYFFAGDEEATPTSETIATEDQYRTAFIQANIDFTCELIANPALESDSNTMKVRLNSNYETNGLPVEDNELMIQILDLYENDNKVLSEIRAGTAGCE